MTGFLWVADAISNARNYYIVRIFLVLWRDRSMKIVLQSLVIIPNFN